MEKELEKILKDYAEKRADEVFDIDIDELRGLVIDGGKKMFPDTVSTDGVRFCGDDSGQEGYDIRISFEGSREVIYNDTNQRISPYDELDEKLFDKPNGIYDYDGENFKIIENWEE